MTAGALTRPPIPVPPESLARARAKVFGDLAKTANIETPRLEQFFINAWPILEPGIQLIPNWTIGYICEHLEAVADGEILRLAISVPPRELKSTIATIAFPAWVWIRRSWKKFMTVSYSQSLSTDHSVKRRRLIDSKWFQEKWGRVFQWAPDQNQKAFYENTAGGAMLATSAGGVGTGKGADIQIFDDFINPKEAESETERAQKIEDFKNTFSNRLNDPKSGARIIVAQRTHRNDLTGYALAEEGDYTHIELPIRAEQRRVYSFPKSGAVRVREVGDILNPDRHTEATIAKQKRVSGSRAFGAQYMCAPSKEDGSMCPKAWWQFYREPPRVIFERGEVRAQSWDFAFKDLETSSFVCGYVIVRIGAKKYVVAERRDHLNFPSTCKAVKAMNNQWPGCSFKFYEDRANGPAVQSQLSGKISGLIPVEPIGSKAARFAAASPDIEAGDVLLPYPYDADGHVVPEFQWVVDLMEEVEKFPEEPNDRGDALAQGVIKLNNVLIHDESADEEGGSILMNGDSGDADFEPINFGGMDVGADAFGGDYGTL